jgi:tellurite resistance-related uncharacterized protein
VPDDQLPPGLELVRTTTRFDEHSVPPGLLRAHRIAEGMWGRIVVHTGALGFTFEDADRAVTVPAGGSLVIPPDRPHHVEVTGPVSFDVEFHRAPAAGARRAPA